MNDDGFSAIAHVIQLAVAPVFLLAGIGGILNVVATRLARVVDRVRSLERDVQTAEPAVRDQEIRELAILDRRIGVCHWSIGLCTASALLICVVVMTLFLAGLTGGDFGVAVSLLFIGATLCLTLSLVLFLAEITIATRFVRVSEEFVRRTKGRGADVSR